MRGFQRIGIRNNDDENRSLLVWCSWGFGNEIIYLRPTLGFYSIQWNETQNTNPEFDTARSVQHGMNWLWRRYLACEVCVSLVPWILRWPVCRSQYVGVRIEIT